MASRPPDRDREAERVRGKATPVRGKEEGPARPRGKVGSAKDKDRPARASSKVGLVRAGTQGTSVRDKEPQHKAKVKEVRAKVAKRKAASARIKDRAIRDKGKRDRPAPKGKEASGNRPRGKEGTRRQALPAAHPPAQ
jgi:hypothetical protein